MTMPMLIRVEDTITSISRNGIYSRKPISKARFSSVVTKDGITTRIGRSPASASLSGTGTSAILQYSSRLAGAVLRSMNSFNGAWAWSKNSSWVISPAA